MLGFRVLCACAAFAVASGAFTQEIRYKSAVVVLTEDPALRAEFERTLVAKAREHDYDAITSYDLVPSVADVKNKDFVDTMLANGVKAVLMIRPAAIGPGSSLDSVSDSDGDDLIAVVHMAIYLFYGRDPELISSGAVWLDEPVTDRVEGIARLQDLVVANVDAARPTIRRYYRLPPLEKKTTP